MPRATNPNFVWRTGLVAFLVALISMPLLEPILPFWTVPLIAACVALISLLRPRLSLLGLNPREIRVVFSVVAVACLLTGLLAHWRW